MNHRRTCAIAGAVMTIASSPLHAQRLPTLSPTASTSGLELLRSVGTADEKLLLDGVTSRLKSRFADTSWVKRLGDALRVKRSADATRLVLGAVQVSGSAAEFLYPGEAPPTDDADGPLALQPASWHGGVAFNPWYVLVRTPWAFVMICSTTGECKRGRRESAAAGAFR